MADIKWSRYDSGDKKILGNEADINYDSTKVYWCPLKKYWCTREEMIDVPFDELPATLQNKFTNDGLSNFKKGSEKFID